MSEWQPIETAPLSNGSNAFLAFIPGHGCSVCNRHMSGVVFSNATGRVVSRATHWQPLPDPPKP